MVRPVDGPRTIVGKKGYRAKNGPTAHSGPGVRRLAHRWVHSRSGEPLEQGVERDATQEDRPQQKGIAILPGHAAGYKKKAKALKVLPSGKASKGVLYSSAGSGASVGYCY